MPTIELTPEEVRVLAGILDDLVWQVPEDIHDDLYSVFQKVDAVWTKEEETP